MDKRVRRFLFPARRGSLITGKRGKSTMANLTELTLYHGSVAREVKPSQGLGDDRHDYGGGLYILAS